LIKKNHKNFIQKSFAKTEKGHFKNVQNGLLQNSFGSKKAKN
jgi:hypothetical protein